MVGQVLLVAVAVAVAAIVAGPASGFIGAALKGAGMTAAAASATGAIAGGAIAGAAGSIASQGVGLATGIQDKFSWKGVAMSAVGGGVGGGLGNVIKGGGFLAGAARGAAGSALTQGIGVAIGLQKKFDFVGVAAAGLGGGAAGWASSRLGSVPGMDRSVAHALSGGAGALANAATRSALSGTSFGDNLMAALPDVIGSTIGNMIADRVQSMRGRAGAGTGANGALAAAEAVTGEILVNTAALEAAAEGAFGFKIPHFQLPELRPEIWAALDSVIQPLEALPDGTTMSVPVDAYGRWDESRLAYHVRGAPEPTYINMDFGEPDSTVPYETTARGGALDGERVSAVQSRAPSVYRTGSGRAYVYTRVGENIEPLMVAEISSNEMWWRENASFAVNFVPIVGAAKMGGEIISGRDAYAGGQIDRKTHAVGLAAQAVGAGVVGKLTSRGSRTPSVIGSEPILVTPRGLALTPNLLSLQGTSVMAGNFRGLQGATVEEIVSRVPQQWALLPQKQGMGIRFVDRTGVERLRIHGPSAAAPASSNSASGWTLRIHAPNGQYYDNVGNLVGPKSNAGHIPIWGNPKAGN